MKYVPPINSTTTDASYVNGNPATANQGSIPPAAAFENPQREIVNMITDSQQVPTDQDLHQMTRAIRDGKLLWCIDSGPLNQVQIAALMPILLSYTPGLTLHVFIAHTNTGPTTISIGSLNPTAIKRRDGSELQANDMIAGQVVTLVSDGTFFQLQNMGIGGTGGVGSTFKVDIPYVHDTGAQDPDQVNAAFKNHVIGPYSPPLPDINEGRTVEVKLDQTILGPTDFTPNNFPTHPVAHPDGTPIVAGDGVPNQIWLLVFDSVQWQLLDVYNSPVTGPTIPAQPKTYVGRSLQFQDPGAGTWATVPWGSMPYFSRTPSIQSNRSVWTQSAFFKWSTVLYRPYGFAASYSGTDNGEVLMVSAGDGGASWGGCAGDWTGISFTGSPSNTPMMELFWAYSYGPIAGGGDPQSYTGMFTGEWVENAIATDTKWHHLLAVADGAYLTTYLDSVQTAKGAYATGGGPNGTINAIRPHTINAEWTCKGTVYGCRARMAELFLIDGQALTWDKFAKVVDGSYVPIDVGTNLGLNFGTNGFYLNWQDSSDCTSTTLGKDWSGQGNNWLPLNFTTSRVYNDFPGNPTS